MTDIVKLYNPASAASLTPEQLEGMQRLTSPELKELATAYPNAAMQRAYLLIIDSSKPVSKQLPTLSSFENLWNLREKNGLRNFVAFSFKGTYKPAATNVRPKRTEVLDLSESELKKLPGFRTANTTEGPKDVEVKKIRKAPIKAAAKKAAAKKATSNKS